MRIIMLKRIPLLLIFLIVLLAAVSCAGGKTQQETGANVPSGNEEADNVPHFDDMIGAWSGKYSGSYSDENITFALRKDGTGYIITDGYIRTFSFSYDGGVLALEYDSDGTMLPISAVCRSDGSGKVLVDFGNKTLLLSDRQNTFMTDGLSQVGALVGVWSGIETNGQRVTYTFNADGTGEYFVQGKKSSENVTWSANGNILVVGRGVSAVMFEYEEDDGYLAMSSVAASGAQLSKRIDLMDGLDTDKALYGTWKLSKIRDFYDGDIESYKESVFSNDYRMVFSRDGYAYETHDNAEIYRYTYGTAKGGEAIFPDETVFAMAELFIERVSNEVQFHSYTTYEIVDGELIVYGSGSARVYTYLSESETAVVDYGIPSKLVGTWIGQLVMDGASGTIMLTLNDDGTGRIVLDSDTDMEYTVSADSIAIIYNNENHGYIFAIDLNNGEFRISYRSGAVVYLMNKVTENGGVWKKFTVDGRLYGSWGNNGTKYVFNDDGTGYISAGSYKYPFNYMAADGTLILNVVRPSLLSTVKYAYSFDNGSLIIQGDTFTRAASGDVEV
ncbi:MAG: hypothetical protein J5940_03270 [Clostridia bacterium]|nr:hypothetical protein [Clostridia bacterium]